MGLRQKVKNAKRLLHQQGYIVLEPSPATDMAKDIHSLFSGYDIEKVTRELRDFFENEDNDESDVW